MIFWRNQASNLFFTTFPFDGEMHLNNRPKIIPRAASEIQILPDPPRLLPPQMPLHCLPLLPSAPPPHDCLATSHHPCVGQVCLCRLLKSTHSVQVAGRSIPPHHLRPRLPPRRLLRPPSCGPVLSLRCRPAPAGRGSGGSSTAALGPPLGRQPCTTTPRPRRPRSQWGSCRPPWRPPPVCRL